MYIVYALIPIIGALIGWITNVLAIKLLFRPFEPIILGPFALQGLIPKRRTEIAQAVAETVALELVDIGAVLKQATTPEIQAELSASIVRMVEQRGKERLPVFIPDPFRAMIMDYLCKTVSEELEHNLPSFLADITSSLQSKIDIRSMVVERIEAMDLRELEALVLKLAHRELKAIEYLGGILGFAIGLVQLAAVVWL